MRLEELPDFTALQQLARALWREDDARGAAVFVGSGFSRNADRLSEDAPKAPLWAELTNDLAVELYGVADHPQAQVDPLRLAEEYRSYFGQAQLDEFVRRHVPDDAWRPGKLHRSLLKLPWSDVLTTNWDTLLERTAELIAGHAYEPVKAMADMAHARSPRIVKLHGSLGTSQHFVFAEEDYRTYPVRYAAFVNLARQVFLESELCLIGFSGDDPNFLQWSGWVRDHLGGSARRIYLVGDLGLTPPKRKLLESRNVAPIDLAPLVQHLDPDQRASEAVSIFLAFLHQAKPRRPHEWTPADEAKKGGPHDVTAELHKQHVDPHYAADLFANASDIWRADRQSYPHWLVCPSSERQEVIHKTSLAPRLSDAAIVALGTDRRGLVFYELAWRHATALWPLDAKLLEQLVDIMDPERKCGLTKSQHYEIAVQVMDAARKQGNDALFKECAVILNSGASDASFRAEAAYQQLLYWRDNLEHQNLQVGLASFKASGPIWNLRLAALHCECGDFTTATQLIEESFLELRARQWRNRQSLWVKSRRAWTQWIRSASLARISRNNEEQTWPSEFREARCDPWDELDRLKRDAAETLRRRYEEKPTIVPSFRAGSYKDRANTVHLKNFGEINVFTTLNYLIDHVGIPIRLQHANLIGELANDAAEIDFQPTLRWYLFFLRAVSSHSSPLLDRYFSRTAVAQMTLDLVQALSDRVHLCVRFWRRKASSARLSDEFDGAATERLRLFIEVLARLAPRQTIDQAIAGVTFAAELAVESKSIHQWLYEPIGHLAEESVAAAGGGKHRDVMLSLLRFPLSEEKQKTPFHWPNPVTGLLNSKDGLTRDADDEEWTQEIRRLLERVRSPSSDRAEAALRLVYLANTNRLNPDEIQSLGRALWTQVDDAQPPLPARTDLLPHIFIHIPAPCCHDAGKAVRSRLFQNKLMPNDTYRFYEITAAANSTVDGFGVLPTRLEAVRMFDEILNWPTPALETEAQRVFGKEDRRRTCEYVGQVIALALVPQFDPEDFTDDRVSFLFQPSELSSSYDQLPALPHLARAKSERLAEVALTIRRSMSKAGFKEMPSVARAVAVWLELTKANKLSELPQDVKERIFSGAEAIRLASQPLLWCSRKIVEAHLATEAEIARLKSAIGDLFSAATYDQIDSESLDAVSVSFLRAECVRLAHALKLAGSTGPEIDGWLMAAPLDPLPEVRFALNSLG